MNISTSTLPQGWRLARFDEFLKRVERKIILDDSTAYSCVGVRLYGNGAFVREKLTGLEIARKQQWILKSGDVVYNKLFAWKGTFTFADDSVDGCIVSDKFPTYEADLTKITSRFLGHFFKTSQLWKQAQDLSRGAAALSKFTLNPPQFWELTIPLPPLAEQQRIAERIDALVSKIETTRSLYAQRRKALEQIIESCIGDITAHFSELGKFAEVITFSPRSGPSFPTDPDWNGKPVLMPSSVTGFKLNTSKVEFGPGNESISRKDLLLPGDILIARGNKREQVGNAGVVPDKAEGWVCANLLMRLQVNTAKVDPFFCIYWLRSPVMRNYVKQNMTGTNPNIQKINQQTILNFPFPSKVPLGDQRRIVAYLNDLQAKVDALKRLQAETTAELEVLLPSVLDQAFRGEL